MIQCLFFTVGDFLEVTSLYIIIIIKKFDFSISKLVKSKVFDRKKSYMLFKFRRRQNTSTIQLVKKFTNF